MRKIIAILLYLVSFSSAFAADVAQLKISIHGAMPTNKYFLCLYGVGCLSIRAGSKGKVFAIQPIDVGNIVKMVITDSTNMAMYLQPNVKSCAVNLKAGDELTISGQLVVKGQVPHIDGLSCKMGKS